MEIDAWLDRLFGLPVEAKPWLARRPGAYPELDPDTAYEHSLAVFEHGGTLLARFDDAQVGQGLWAWQNELVGATMGENRPLSDRLRAVRALAPFFEQVMAARCTPTLGHLSEPGTPVNGICYMWFELWFGGRRPRRADRAAFQDASLEAAARILEIPHDACREGVLHGLGHGTYQNPRPRAVIAAFLEQTPDLRPELRQYAQRALRGAIL